MSRTTWAVTIIFHLQDGKCLRWISSTSWMRLIGIRPKTPWTRSARRHWRLSGIRSSNPFTSFRKSKSSGFPGFYPAKGHTVGVLPRSLRSVADAPNCGAQEKAGHCGREDSWAARLRFEGDFVAFGYGGVLLELIIFAVGEIGTVVAAAALLAGQGGTGDQ